MLSLGAQPNQTIYANPCKQSSHIEFARDNQVNLIVFDNAEELMKLKKIFPTAKFVALVIFHNCTIVMSFNPIYFIL